MHLQTYSYQGQEETRAGFGKAMTHLGKTNNRIIALSSDLTSSLKLDDFAKLYPERFIQVGIAEANMICIAAGLSINGKIPFATSFANFATGRVYDQIRQSIAYSETNVKICASHAGLTLGEDGATHQILEDIGLMKMLPNMVVLNPCDYNQTFLATLAIAAHKGPVYLRFGRPKTASFTLPNAEFQIGKGIIFKEGLDVSIIATGHLVWPSILASDYLKEEHNIYAEVINIHTIKPLDTELILNSARKTHAVVTAEEHQTNGGLGDSVAQLLSQTIPTIQEYISVKDSFGESGKPEELMDKYHLNTQAIIEACLKAIKRKQ
ncbi:MAG: transketolase family protein [Solitalea-like symbiont of Tyrophagus putrescentiae]